MRQSFASKLGGQFATESYGQFLRNIQKDPEMCFIVVNNMQEQAKAYEMVKIIPYLFQQDNAGLFEESVIFTDNKTTKYSPKMNADHAAFANLWLGNIKNQGFLKPCAHNS